MTARGGFPWGVAGYVVVIATAAYLAADGFLGEPRWPLFGLAALTFPASMIVVPTFGYALLRNFSELIDALLTAAVFGLAALVNGSLWRVVTRKFYIRKHGAVNGPGTRRRHRAPRR